MNPKTGPDIGETTSPKTDQLAGSDGLDDDSDSAGK
jgi:hypothetical protein